MTSPVDTSVKFFTSKMLGAPVLKGQAGSLIALLDACLKDGWGIQTASSAVVAGGVCTMTFPLDHAAPVDAVVLVAGASIAALNGEQKVTATAPNVVKFATAAADGAATGTITAKMAPLGWLKPFTGTNLAVYKSADVAANGQFLRVNDTGTTSARAVGYETMTAISTGTGLFPTAAQLSGGLYWAKSVLAGTVPVDWLIVGDSRFFGVFTSIYQGNGAGYEAYRVPMLFGFGDQVNLGRSADPFCTTVFGSTDESSYTASYILSAGNGQFRYMPRAITGIGTSVQATATPMCAQLGADEVFDRISGRVMFSELVVKTDETNSWRAKLPGMCVGEATFMEMAFSQFGLFKAGTPEKSYLSVLTATSPTALSSLTLIAIDVTGPWR